MEFQQGHYTTVAPESTGILGSLGGIGASMGVAGGYGSILDDLQVAFLIRATQARVDVKSLNAPRVTVINGETATWSNQEQIYYMTPPSRTTTVIPSAIGSPVSTTSVVPAVQQISPAPSAPLTITPIISNDKKYVILNIQFSITGNIKNS